MKKVLKSFMLTLVGLLTVATLVACGEKKHEHNYTYESLATKHRQVCKDCDDKQPWEPHVYGDSWTIEKEATETEKGSRYHNCTVCNWKETEDIDMIMPQPGVTADFTAIYVKALADWSEVYVYYWGNKTEDGGNTLDEGYAVSWPGVEMTLVDEATYLYGFIIPAGVANIIFTDGSAQTVDINYAPSKNLLVVEEDNKDGEKYKAHYDSYEAKETDPELGKAESSVVEKMTIYAQLPVSWEVQNIHYWGTKLTTDWPGAPMTLVDETLNLYKYDGLPVGSTIILNNKVGDDGVQTGSLTVPEGVNTFVVEDEDTISYGMYKDGVITPVEVEIEIPELYIRGDMNNWNTLTDDYKLVYDEKNDRATITIAIAKDQKFKIGDANWAVSLGYVEELGDAFSEGEGGNIVAAKAGTYTFIVEGLKAKASLSVLEMMDLYVQTDWTTVNLHYFGTKLETSWPGATMTLVDGSTNIYTVKVPVGTKVIVNNKVGDDGVQTGNLPIPEGVNIFILEDKDTISYGMYQDGVITPVEVEKEAPVFYVRGDMNSWGAPDDFKLSYDKDTDTASIEIILLEGVNFKIADMNWVASIGYVDTLGAEFAAGAGGNITVVTSGTYVITITDLLGTPTLTIVKKA